MRSCLAVKIKWQVIAMAAYQDNQDHGTTITAIIMIITTISLLFSLLLLLLLLVTLDYYCCGYMLLFTFSSLHGWGSPCWWSAHLWYGCCWWFYKWVVFLSSWGAPFESWCCLHGELASSLLRSLGITGVLFHCLRYQHVEACPGMTFIRSSECVMCMKVKVWWLSRINSTLSLLSWH